MYNYSFLYTVRISTGLLVHTCGYIYVYTQIAYYSRTAVPSSVVTVTLYSSEAGRVALRMTMTDVLFSDTLYSTGSKSTIIAAEK